MQQSRSEMVLKAFLSRCPPEKRSQLERFLSQQERDALERLPSFDESITPEGFSNSSWLERVHWSWFLPTLKTFSPREQGLFLSALSPLVAEQLGAALELSEPREKITEIARAYFRHQLLSSLVGPHERLLPIDYLPPSKLNRLLGFTKKELTQLIDRLALFDLAAELRHIVDTKLLKKLHGFLSEETKAALKALPPQKEFSPLPRLGLDHWDGQEETLRTLLHRRGLTRLGLALSGQDPDLIWALCHQLDIGRGGHLFKLCAKEPVPELSSLMQQQIEELCG